MGTHREWRNVAYSHDGKLVLTGSADHTARVWNAITGRSVAILHEKSGDFVHPAFSPNDKRVVVLSTDGTMRVWDATKWTPVFVLRSNGRSLDAAYSPNGKMIATTNGASIRLWNAATGAAIAVLRGHTDIVRSVVFSPDGLRLVTGSRDKDGTDLGRQNRKGNSCFPRAHELGHCLILSRWKAYPDRIVRWDGARVGCG